MIAFQIVLLLVVTLVSCLHRLRYLRTPVQLLIDVVALVAHRSWKHLSRSGLTLSEGESQLGKTGIKYLAQREIVLRRAERDEAIRRRGEIWSRRQPSIAEEREEHPAWVSDLLVAVALAFMASVLVGLPLLMIWILTQYPSIVVWVAGVCALLALINLLLPYLPKPAVEYSLATGSREYWRDVQLRSSRACDEQSDLLMSMMDPALPPGDSGSEGVDPDLALGEAVSIPITPGITEIALMNSNSIAQIRLHLQKTRSFHRLIASTSVFLFVVSVVSMVAAAIFLDPRGIEYVFGGVGLSAILATFSYLTSGQARVSQIALALFESYVAELQVSLSEAESERMQTKKRERRAAAWTRFRLGLNELWLSESRSLTSWKTDTGAPKELEQQDET